MKLDPDMIEVKHLLQEMQTNETEERIAGLPEELQQKYAAIKKAMAVLIDADVPATIFAHPEGPLSLFQSNNWKDTLYKTKDDDDNPNGQDVADAWTSTTRGFIAYVSGPMNKPLEEVSIEDLMRWFAWAHSRDQVRYDEEKGKEF